MPSWEIPWSARYSRRAARRVEPVVAVDAGPLKIVQVTAQVRRGEEDRGLDTGNPVPDVERPGCLPELTRNFFRL